MLVRIHYRSYIVIIIAGRRNLTTEQALKVEISLGYEKGF